MMRELRRRRRQEERQEDGSRQDKHRRKGDKVKIGSVVAESRFERVSSTAKKSTRAK